MKPSPISCFLARLAFLLCSLLIGGQVLHAQSATATITGHITDPSEAVLPEAKVVAVNIETNVSYSTTTNGAGIFVLANLPPASYRVEVSKPGFKTAIQPEVILHVQDVVPVNLTLPIGATTESVTVSGTAAVVNSESPAVSTVIDRQFVSNIPLNGRTLQSLITLTPGVVLTPTSFDEQGQFSVNGQRSDANYYTVDGVSANAGITGTLVQRQSGGSVPALSAQGTTSNLVSIDAVQEFRIQTSTFAPEYGRSPGAQISIVTRSGANQFHGTAFEYFRNDKLDANNWFANRNGLAKPQERMNDFGGVLGGPILKNKTFFFFSYEGLRVRQPLTLETLVPNLAARQLGPNAAVTASLNAFPLPNAPATAAQTAAGIGPANGTLSNPSELNSTSLRLDHSMGDRFKVFARYNLAPSSMITHGGGLPGNSEPLNFEANSRLRTTTATAGLTAILTPRIANEFLFNYTRNSSSATSALTSYGGATIPDLMVLVPPTSGVSIPYSDISYENNIIGIGLFDLGPASKPIQRQLNFVDNFSYVKGKHQFKFGFDYRRLNPVTGPAKYGYIPVFYGVSTSPIGAFNLTSGVALESLIVSNDPVALLFPNYSSYAQDAWAVTPRLKLTYGLRWEINPAPTTTGGTPLVTFVDPYNVNNLTLAPQGTRLYKTTYDNFAPRAGIAYDLNRKNGWETVIRGGYGLFYDLGNNQVAAAASSFPFLRLAVTMAVPYPFPPSVAAPVPLSLNPPYGQLAVTDPNLKLPRTHEWNVAVEQSLGANQSLAVTYVGAIGRDELRDVSLKSPAVANGELIFTNGATSDYHGLQTQFKRRFSHGLQVLASYTWSHSIDTQSSNTGSNGAPAAGFVSLLERGPSAFDVRHEFSGAVTYDIPKTEFGFISKVFLNGWAVNTIISARSATPLSVAYGSIPGSGGSTISQRPNINAGQPIYLSDPNAPGGRRLNLAAFSKPATTIQGNLGRDALRGFSAVQADLSLRREFRLWERTNLQLRSEFFNILNHPNFANYNPNLNSSLFGVSPSTLATSLSGAGLSQLFQFGGPRSIQLALKLSF